jgi:hypothetical protein
MKIRVFVRNQMNIAGIAGKLIIIYICAAKKPIFMPNNLTLFDFFLTQYQLN